VLADRQAAVLEQWPKVLALRDQCEAAGLTVPELVCGGTPTFPVYAGMQAPGLTLSPGTCVFHDAGYGSQFPDLKFEPAAGVLTRVVSRPAADRATLDLGNKAVAADPPRGHRVFFPDFPNAIQDIHNEEHLVLVDPELERLAPGDALLGIPMHICPTSALYDRVLVSSGGTIVDEWPVTSRNRRLTI
jgi:D-serine deaminase-like pyridoxal phosphate-dependent protein